MKSVKYVRYCYFTTIIYQLGDVVVIILRHNPCSGCICLFNNIVQYLFAELSSFCDVTWYYNSHSCSLPRWIRNFHEKIHPLCKDNRQYLLSSKHILPFGFAKQDIRHWDSIANSINRLSTPWLLWPVVFLDPWLDTKEPLFVPSRCIGSIIRYPQSTYNVTLMLRIGRNR